MDREEALLERELLGRRDEVRLAEVISPVAEELAADEPAADEPAGMDEVCCAVEDEVMLVMGRAVEERLEEIEVVVCLALACVDDDSLLL